MNKEIKEDIIALVQESCLEGSISRTIADIYIRFVRSADLNNNEQVQLLKNMVRAISKEKGIHIINSLNLIEFI